MLGDGYLFAEVHKEIARQGMSERFDLPGWVTPEQVLDHFSKSDILFMPSLSEGLPVVGVQALATGLVIVASRIGGFLDLVDHEKNGYLIEVQDIPAFSRVLRGILSNPRILLRFRQASVDKSHDFDIEKVVAQYQLIFLNILSGE